MNPTRRGRRAHRSRSTQLAFALWAALALSACGSTDLYEGQPEHVRRRHLGLEGAPNFRDLGGYATEDGRSVRWGLFYRSDNLAHLTDDDLARLEELDLALVCDFRGPDEKAEEPDRLPEKHPPAVAELEIYDDSFSATSFREKLLSGDEDFDAREILIEGNRLFASKFSDRYAQMFQRISHAENLPAVVHCTAGKDRAGFASALILRTLGVPMETVYDDFLLTNLYTQDKIERTLLMVRLYSLFQVDPEKVRPILGVERAFLEAAFDEIDREYGTFDAYRRDALGLNDAELAAFQTLGLE